MKEVGKFLVRTMRLSSPPTKGELANVNSLKAEGWKLVKRDGQVITLARPKVVAVNDVSLGNGLEEWKKQEADQSPAIQQASALKSAPVEPRTDVTTSVSSSVSPHWLWSPGVILSALALVGVLAFAVGMATGSSDSPQTDPAILKKLDELSNEQRRARVSSPPIQFEPLKFSQPDFGKLPEFKLPELNAGDEFIRKLREREARDAQEEMQKTLNEIRRAQEKEAREKADEDFKRQFKIYPYNR